MFDVLGFNLSTTVCSSEKGEKYTLLNVRPVVNGINLIESAFSFDISQILAQRAAPGSPDIFTCGCGCAGCAGIHEECYLTADENSVSWQFPSDPFEKNINPSLRKDRDALTFVFERNQYLDSLNSIASAMIVEAELASTPVHYHCDLVYSVDDLIGSIPERLIEDKVHFERRLERERQRQACFRELTGSSMEIALGQGIVLEIGVENLLRRVADDSGYEDEAATAYVSKNLVPMAISDPAYLQGLIEEMTWEQVWNASWVSAAGTETEGSSIEALMPFLYPNAKVTFRAA